VLVFSSSFIVQRFLVFFCEGVQSAQGSMLVYRRGGWENTAWHLALPCWFGKCLPSRFGASVWQWGTLQCFLSVMCSGEAFHSLGVQVVDVLILLAALFPPSVVPASQWGFGVMELTLPASVL
jgi:hypothetical protein